jgi:hypothetical protein
MVKCGVLFEVRAEFLGTIRMSFGFKGLKDSRAFPQQICYFSWSQRLEEKFSCPCRGSNLNGPVIQSVVRQYTDWATATPNNDNYNNVPFRTNLRYTNPPVERVGIKDGLLIRSRERTESGHRYSDWDFPWFSSVVRKLSGYNCKKGHGPPPPIMEALSQNDSPKSQQSLAKAIPYLLGLTPRHPPNQSYFRKGHISWRIHVPANDNSP